MLNGIFKQYQYYEISIEIFSKSNSVYFSVYDVLFMKSDSKLGGREKNAGTTIKFTSFRGTF